VEASLPELSDEGATTLAIHPGLLACVVRAVQAGGLVGRGAGHTDGEQQIAGEIHVPGSWTGVSLLLAGARQLRMRISPVGENAVSLIAADADGSQVLRIASIELRPAEVDRLAVERSRQRDTLFCLDWVSLPASRVGPSDRVAVLGVDALVVCDSLRAAGVTVEAHEDLSSLTRALDRGLTAPELVLVECVSSGESESDAESVRLAVERALELVQTWLAEERLVETRLALITRGAVLAGPDEPAPDLALAPVWGLMRSAQIESPGRLVLVDCDGEESSWNALPAALATGEPQLALRRGALRAPRLARLPSPGAAEIRAFDPHGTVLITGEAAGPAGLVARHLVAEHGVAHVMLASRLGRESDGAGKLESELQTLGSRVTSIACDLSDREAVKELIASVPVEHPLRGIVHAASVNEDGAVDSMTSTQLDRALAPAVDGALHLHELTRHLDLSAFVMFSSVAGTLGKAGAGAGAAANAFLDAIAAHRRAQGLPAISIAWGRWAYGIDVSGQATELEGLPSRSGVGELSAQEGLRLFDRLCRADAAVAIAMRLDVSALRVLMEAEMLPVLLRGLVRGSALRPRGDVVANGSLVRRLRELPDGDHALATLEAVRQEVATVLGHASPAAVDPRRTFKELGFDSLKAIELRNKLSVVTDLRLPPTLVFNNPTSALLSEYLLERLSHEAIVDALPVQGELESLEAAIAVSAMDGSERAALQARLHALIAQMGDVGDPHREKLTVAVEIESATADEVIDFIDRQLGAP